MKDLKLLSSVAVVLMVMASVGATTFAYFSDTETVTGNTFTTGTIDLTLTGSFSFDDIKPCKDLDPVTVEFRNIGTNPGYLYNKIEYSPNDSGETPDDTTDLTADEFAALIYVETVTYQHYSPNYPGDHWGSIKDDLTNWLSMDSNGDGYLSLYEIKKVGWLPYDVSTPEEPLADGEGGKWVITFHMADSLLGHTWGQGDPTGAILTGVTAVEDNAPQADGISMTWTAVLKQTSGPPA